MARVSTVSSQVRRLTGGLDRFDIEAPTLRALLAELDRRHPGLADEIGQHLSIVIDGEVHTDAGEVALGPDAEVVLIPRIAAG